MGAIWDAHSKDKPVYEVVADAVLQEEIEEELLSVGREVDGRVEGLRERPVSSERVSAIRIISRHGGKTEG